MAASSNEVILRFTGDRRQLKTELAAVATDYAKTGQAITATSRQVNAKIASDFKTQTNEALKDIARLERERLQIMKQNEKAIEGLAKQEANSRIREAKRAANQFLESLRNIQREEARLRASLAKSTASGTSAFLAGAAGGVTALLGVSAVSEIRQAGAAWVDYSSKLQNTRIAFTTMLGSAQLAEDHLKELQQFALKTPFQFSDLIDASQRMQALGFNAQQVIPVLTDVGNAVAAAGGGSERLDRVVLALSQIQSKGKVMTQELNQLAEAGIPAFRILQETLHKSRAEINDLVKDGQISSKVFLDAFQKFSQQNFGGLMEAQSKTFTGAMSNIKDALLQTSATAFAPLFEKLSELAVHFSEVATTSKEFQEQLKTVGQVTSTIFDGLVEVIIAFRDAFRLVIAAVTAQITFLVEGFKALAHALTAVFFESFAAGKALRGDFVAAAKAQKIAQEELKLATDAAAKSFSAINGVIRTTTDIYQEAEARAKALANAQATVGGGPVIGAGILRKKPVSEGDEDLTKKTKGSDPAAAAKRIAEIQLRAVLDNIQLEEEGIGRSLRKRLIEYGLYETKLEALESQRHQAVIGGLKEEAEAASKLRDPNAKSVAFAEIEARRVEENNKHQSEIDKRTDASEAHKRKEFEATTDIIRATIDTQLKIADIGDQQRIAAIRAIAEARVTTEEEAERKILQIRLDAIDREKERIETEIKATASIRDPEEQLKTRAKLNLELRELAEKRTAIEEDGARDVEAARRRDVANERRYADDIKAIKQQIEDVERETARTMVALMEANGARRKDIILARARLEIDDENQRHKRTLDAIALQERENRESQRTEEEKFEFQQQLNRRKEAEEQQHQINLQQIQSQHGVVIEGKGAEEVVKQVSVVSEVMAGLKQQMVDFSGFIKTTFVDSLFAIGDALAQGIAAWAQYGGSFAQAMKQALAAIGAKIAAEATLQALLHGAYAIGSLAFGNFAAAAQHAIAAAKFAAIAGVAVLATRALAGNSFSQSSGAGSSSSGNSNNNRPGTNTSAQPKPVNLDRNTLNQQAIVVHLDVRQDEGIVVKAIVNNHRSNGEIRQMIVSEMKR